MQNFISRDINYLVMVTKTGWYNKNMTGNPPKYESHRHSLASRGIKTSAPKGVKGVSSAFSPTPNFDKVAKGQRIAKKRHYVVFGKKKNEPFGKFYHFLSTSKSGAEQQARKKYNLRILDVRLGRKTQTSMIIPKDWAKMKWKDKQGNVFNSLVPKAGLKDTKENVLMNGGSILNMDMIDKYEYNMGISKNALRTFFKKHTGRDVLKDMKFSVVTQFKDNPNKIGHYNPDTKTLTIRKDQLLDLKKAVSVMAHEIVHKIGKNYDETRAFENDLSYALGHAILD